MRRQVELRHTLCGSRGTLLEVALVRREIHVLARWDHTRSFARRWLQRRKCRQSHGDRWGHVHRLGLAGNVVALAAIVLVCCNGDLLLSERQGSARSMMADGCGPAVDRTAANAAGGWAEQLVLVVIDGLRADAAFDPQQMPFLSQLAAQHGRATARVESLIPSSIAGIATITTGDIPPPISFLSDFGAAAAQQGGVLQAVAASGGRCFVAGPTLWTDLYGEWVAAAELDATFGQGDQRLTAAALAAIHSAQYRLVVLHLGRVDAAAHHFGLDSAQYAAAASACDQAIAQVRAVLPADAGLIVTSDHGNTRTGGHAGPEPAVLMTPLVVVGEQLPAMTGEVTQSSIAGLMAESLGVARHMPAGVPRCAATCNARRVGSSALERFGAIVLVTLCGLALCSAASGRDSGSRQAFALNSVVWLSLGFAMFVHVGAAVSAGLAVFAAAAISTRFRISPVIIGCCVIGAAVGALRLGDGVAALNESADAPALPHTVVGLSAPLAFTIGQVPLAAVFLLSIAVGTGLKEILRRTGFHAVGGAALAVAYVVLSRVLGETVSLSSIDVRTGFCLIQWPGGLLWACLLVIANQAIAAAGLLLGSRAAIVSLAAKDFGGLASGAAAVLLGQLLIVAGLFAYTTTGQTIQALGLGLLIRVIAESSYFFLGLLLVLHVGWFGGRARAGSITAASP